MALNKAELQKIQTQLRPLRDELNLRLVSSDLREFDMLKLGEVLSLLDQTLEVFAHRNLPVFEDAVSVLNQFAGEIISESIAYHTGMSYVLNLHELFEDSLDAFLSGNDILAEFERLVIRLKGLFDSVEITEISESTSDDEAVIQVLKEDALEDGILIDFLSECEDGLEMAESSLLELENDPSDHDPIHPLFRRIHTIKGTSGFLGLNVIGTVAHHLEDLLVQVRDGYREYTSQISDSCFQSVDTLKQLLQQVKSIIEGSDIEPVNVRSTYNILATCLNIPLEPQTPPPNEPFSAEESSDSPSASSKQHQSVGEILVSSGKVSAEEVEEEIERQQKPIGEMLVDRGLVSEDDVQNALKQQSTQSGKPKLTEMVKVSADNLDELAELVGEMVVALSVLSQNPVISSITDRGAHERLDQLDKVTEKLRDRILGVRMFPVGNVFSKLSRQVRDLSKKSGKRIKLHVEGADTLVDKTVIDGIYGPLVHLVRNAIDHGIEPAEGRNALDKPEEGHILLKANHMGDSIMIEVKDDGKGLQKEVILQKALERGLTKEREKLNDQNIFAFIFQPGFSTAKQVTDVSGRGVGMDVVKRDVESLRGKITIESTPQVGTSFLIKLPLTTSIIEGLVVRIGQSRFIVPILDVNLTVTPKPDELKGVQGKEGELFILAGELIPILRLYQFYKIDPEITDPSKAIIIVVQEGSKKYGLMVDELLHRQQIVIKNLGSRFEHLRGITGGTILGDGRVGLILEPEEVINHFQLPQT